MDIKIIERALKDYQKDKSIIETTLLRIDQFKKVIDDPGDIAIGDKEMFNQWIKEDYSKIYPYQIEKEQIDIALGALTMQQRFIIECKYINNMYWRDIEIVFNERFKERNYITVSGLRKMAPGALRLLADILKPYYDKFNIKR